MDDPAKYLTKVKVMTRNDFDVTLKADGFYYTIQGIHYPLKDTAALRKHYRETKREELKPID